MNTWGLLSINETTFNLPKLESKFSNPFFPKALRNVVYTVLKISNLVFNFFAYFVPAASLITGSLRIGCFAIVLTATLFIGTPHAKQGALIEPWYSEAKSTAICQITRGALEILGTYGKMVNLGLDIIATPYNIFTSYMRTQPEKMWDSELQENVMVNPQGHSSPNLSLLGLI